MWRVLAFQLITFGSFAAGQNFANLSYREVEQKILESLLKPPYDSRIRPMDSTRSNDSTGTLVTINMFIRSFDFIDDVNMQYGIQLTFRQQWNDNRLRFTNFNPPAKLKYLTLSRASPIWTPDIFFSNEKTSHFHDMLVPNTFVRVFPNGDVLYSARLSMTLSCPMQLKAFPFDFQTCYLRMASYGYTTEDLVFRWQDNPLQLTPHLELPRFSLEKFTTEYCDSTTTTGTYSCIVMKFGMRRDSSYYNSQIFMPCAMLVVIGWMSFWINRYEPTARLVVLIATLLVMATLIGGFNVTVPKVSYTKASDVWTVSCFLFIFLALFQYIIVHYLTSCETRKPDDKDKVGGEHQSLVGGDSASPQAQNNDVELSNLDNKSVRNRRDPDVDKLFKFYEYWTWSWFKKQPIGHQVDLGFRFAYPLAFFIFNLSYWPQYYAEATVK